MWIFMIFVKFFSEKSLVENKRKFHSQLKKAPLINQEKDTRHWHVIFLMSMGHHSRQLQEI